MAIVTGAKTIGFSNRPYDVPATLPPPADAPQAVLDDLIQRLTNVEILAQGKADANSIRSLIAFSDEDVLISGRNIVLNGAVTFTDIVNEQNGTTSGLVDPLITRIIGDRIQTGSITSNNWGTSQGTAIDLDNETVTFGGSANPKLFFDGTDLFIEGTINAGVIQSIGFGASEGIQIDLDNETITAGGSSSPKLYYDGAGNLSITGTISSGSTIAGTSAGTVVANAADGLDIHDKLLSGGTAILTGVIQPTSTGAVRVGSITWNSSTGALTGGTGVAITEFGIIGASSGSATFTLEAATGDATFAGDVVTAGQVKATGSTSDPEGNYSIVGNPSSSSVGGVIGRSSGTSSGVSAVNSSTGDALNAKASAGFAVDARNVSSTNAAIFAGNLSTGPDIELGGTGIIDGFAKFNERVVFKEATPGSSTANQAEICGVLSSDSDTTLSFVTEQAVVTGTTPTPTHRVKIEWNGVEYWMYFEAV